LHRQNNNNPANQAPRAQQRNVNLHNNNQNQNQNRDQNGRGGGEGGRANADLGEFGHGDELDPAHQAWVRHFVRLALNDQEDILLEEEDD
jgi:E3 ubiquitin-protein ligase RNF14